MLQDNIAGDQLVRSWEIRLSAGNITSSVSCQAPLVPLGTMGGCSEQAQCELTAGLELGLFMSFCSKDQVVDKFPC